MASIRIFDLHRLCERKKKVFRERYQLDDVDLETMSAQDIVSRYRLDLDGINYLVALLKDDLEQPTRRSYAVSARTTVLVGLRYLAKGDLFSEVGDLHGLSKSCVSTCFDRFIDAVNDRLDNIRFPSNQQQLEEVKIGFYRKCQIPNVIGAVDGTLIPILAPKDHEETFVCRKGFHALNVQAVVDHKMRFTNIVAKWPGSQHDASIFDSCNLKQHLESEAIGHLLGDSGYPLRTYLLTPKTNPTTEAESRYNKVHSRGRIIIEKAFGVMKSRFRCLHKTGGCLPFSPGKCVKVVSGCARLHNLCIERNIPLLNEVHPGLLGNDDIVVQQNVGSAHALREAIIRQL